MVLANGEGTVRKYKIYRLIQLAKFNWLLAKITHNDDNGFHLLAMIVLLLAHGNNQ